MSALNMMSDDQLARLGVEELVRLIRKCESEKMHIMVDHGSRLKEVNKRMQVHLLEIRGLKEVNQRLQDDNQELRDLCCFLDDDRQKGRKLAREWQRFGRYTSSVMRSEVSTYQGKLKTLESQQQSLLKDNLELKELCLYLDQERYDRDGGSQDRDQGDGSSNTSPMEEKREDLPQLDQYHVSQDDAINRQRAAISEPTLQYIRQLEQRISDLEEDRKHLSERIDHPSSESQRLTDKRFFPTLAGSNSSNRHEVHSPTNRMVPGGEGSMPSKPEAVVHAMKVLEVHEQLDSSNMEDMDDLNDPEKAIVREMCNVVWRKLGDVTPGLQLPGT